MAAVVEHEGATDLSAGSHPCSRSYFNGARQARGAPGSNGGDRHALILRKQQQSVRDYTDTLPTRRRRVRFRVRTLSASRGADRQRRQRSLCAGQRNRSARALAQGFFDICDQIFDIFDADGEANEAVGKTDLLAQVLIN